jgi:hypothetical protein
MEKIRMNIEIPWGLAIAVFVGTVPLLFSLGSGLEALRKGITGEMRLFREKLEKDSTASQIEQLRKEVSPIREELQRDSAAWQIEQLRKEALACQEMSAIREQLEK